MESYINQLTRYIKIGCLSNDYGPNTLPLIYKKVVNLNGVARALKKLRPLKRETTGSSSGSLQLRPVSKWELLLRKVFAPRGSEFFPLRAVSYGMDNHFYHIR